MSIKFTCPHCKRAMVVNDSLAGKKGKCPGCKKIILVPNPAAIKPAAKGQSNSVAPKMETPAPPSPPPPPPPPPADVEAEAAALFSDEPKKDEPVEVKNIEFNCPYCDEPIHFPVDLAGKRAPCPECKHIIKVPELVKQEKKDWRKADQRQGPSGARLPDQPALEGAWGSAEAGKVGRKVLEEAGVIPIVKPPRTLWQKVRLPAACFIAALLLAGVSWGGYRWLVQRGIERAVNEALAYADSSEAKKEIGDEGQAALFLSAADFYLHDKRDAPAEAARKQFGKALTTLQKADSSDEGDAVSINLAVSLVDLGGDAKAPETYKGLRIDWRKAQPLLTAALNRIHNAKARRQAVRAVMRRLIRRGEADRAASVARVVNAEEEDEKAVILCVAALELLKANQKQSAQSVAAGAFQLYEEKKTAKNAKKKDKPPRRAEVVALALVLGAKIPKLGEDAAQVDQANDIIGQVEGLARQQQWDAARRKAALPDLDEQQHFRALLGLAAAAVDAQSADAAADVENAIKAGEKLSELAELSWSLLRLTELALAAGLPEERVQTLAGSIAKSAVRGRAQLAVLRARLAKTPQPVAEDAADKIESKSLSHSLALAVLMFHNTRYGSGGIDKVKDWPQPRKAFGSLGAVRGARK